MRTISTADVSIPPDDELDVDVARFGLLVAEIGRRQPLRDPVCLAAGGLHELTPPQFHTLLWLGTDGALTMGEIARRIGITEKTMTGVIDRLEEAEHLVRERDTSDRRVVRVRLTDKGVATSALIRTHIQGRMRGLLGLLDRDERAALYRILEKLSKGTEDTATTEPGSAREEQR